MSYVFEVLKGKAAQGRLVALGPVDPSNGRQLQIPSESEWNVSYRNPDISVTVMCVLSDGRLEIGKLTVEGEPGGILTSRDLTQLNLPAVLREIGLRAVPNSDYWNTSVKATKLERRTNPEFLAQVYWFEYLTWGSPRQALMDYLEISRTTANTQIRKFATQLLLPGLHATKVQK